MKILHLGQSIGGLDVYLRNVCRYASSDFNFIIVRGKEDNSSPFYNINGELIKEYKISLFREVNLFADINAIHRAIKIIKKEKPDIIHAHSAKGGLVGRIVGLLTKTKVLYTPHAFSFLSSPNDFSQWLYSVIERRTKFGATLLACSKSEYILGLETVKYQSQRISVWSNSVPDVAERERYSDLDIKQPYFCTVGRPCYQKNTMFLLGVISKVVEAIPDFKFILLGVGYHSPELELVKDRIMTLGLDKNIEMVPWLEQGVVFDYIRQSKCYISTTRYEGLPLAILEAMSLSKPIIATRVSGNIDCVEDKENGYLVSFDENEFSTKIIELWRDDYAVKLLGAKSREIYQNKFNINKNIKLLEKLYLEKA